MTGRLRILFTIPNFITAGSGGAMLNIIRRLDRDLFEPAVGVLRKGGALDRTVTEMGIPLIEAPFVLDAKPYSSLLRRAKHAADVFRPYHFDLWHSFHYSDDYTEPLIAYLSGAKGWIYTKKNMNWHSRAWLLRSFLARKIAAQNTDMLEQFFSKPVFNNKTKLIPRGVDLEKYSPKAVAAGDFRKRFGIADREIVISCVAQLVPVKDHPNLICAAARVPGAHFFLPAARLTKATSMNCKGERSRKAYPTGFIFSGKSRIFLRCWRKRMCLFCLPKVWAKAARSHCSRRWRAERLVWQPIYQDHGISSKTACRVCWLNRKTRKPWRAQSTA